MTDGTMSATDSTPTTEADTTQGPGTTQGPSTSGTTTTTVGETTTSGSTSDTGDTTDTTDTTTGVEVTGRSVSQTVNAGHLVTSPSFRLVFTMGQPTQNQGTTSSPNFKLRGGLVGANGSPP